LDFVAAPVRTEDLVLPWTNIENFVRPCAVQNPGNIPQDRIIPSQLNKAGSFENQGQFKPPAAQSDPVDRASLRKPGAGTVRRWRGKW